MNNYLIPNLDKACQLLKLITSNAQGLSASEIEDVTTTPGDTTTASLQEVERVMKGSSARISR